MKQTLAETLAERITLLIPQKISGSLSFWGAWFGKPHDNSHTLVKCEVDEGVLQLFFDQGEKLSLWAADGLTLTSKIFRIALADRVKWEWFYYGKEKVASNLYFEDFVKSENTISISTNIDWYSPGFQPMTTKPALEIHTS